MPDHAREPTSVPLIDIQARWGYSEIVDSTASHNYDCGMGIDELRAKRTEGVRFEQLSGGERYKLAFYTAQVRFPLFVFFTGTDLFNLVQIGRERLAQLYVPQAVWAEQSEGRCMPFGEYMAIPTDNDNDARNVTLKEPTYRAPIDPITVGRFYTDPVLLDGFHRAALFWKFAPAGETLLAYVPRGLSPAIRA